MEAGRLSEIQFAMTSAALDGDAAAIYHIISDLLGQGMPFELVLFDVLAPVQVALGERWQVGDYLISEEHIATNSIETVVALLAGSFEQPDDGMEVIVSCVEGEQHSLPGRMLAAHLLSEGFRTIHLGATMPADDLQQFLIETKPDVAVLTCTMSCHLTGARASINAAHNAGVPVLVGGHAFGADDSRPTRLGADAWAARLRDVATLLHGWQPDLAAAHGAAHEPPGELETLLGERPAIVAATSTRLGGSAAQSALHHADVELAFDHLTASLTVGEPAPLQEFAAWMAATQSARGTESVAVASLLAALRDEVGEARSESRRMLEAALEGP